MKCFIPKYSGFCFGVSLAVQAAYENINNHTYILGDIVHNPSVISDLKLKGLWFVDSIEDISEENAKVLIRAHGVPKKTIMELYQRGFEIIDKTCPRVKNVHEIVSDASNRGFDIIVVGTPNHSEVIGIMGWSKTRTVLLHDMDDAKRIIPNTRFSEKGVCMVAQTTHNKKKYEEIYRYCASFIPNIEFNETICGSTADRQSEMRKLASKCDAVIVVGGKASSNVTKLHEIAAEYCSNTQHVETAAEIDIGALKGVENLVISSGASTPDNSIQEVIRLVSHYCDENDIKLEVIRYKKE